MMITVKQEAWVEAMLTGVTPTEAARIAKYAPKTHKQRGHENVTNSYLIKTINKRRAELRVKTGMTVEKLQQMYEEDRLFASSVNQAGARVSATTGIARLYGMDKDAGSKEIDRPALSPAQQERYKILAKAMTRRENRPETA